MKTPTATVAALSFFLIASIALSACAGAPAAPQTAGPTAPSPSAINACDMPITGGGGAAGNPGTGIGAPGDPVPVDPAPGQGKLVVARPGQLDPHLVAPVLLEASVDGRHVLVRVTWWSGVEPCNVLDSVKVDRSGAAIVLSVFEGSSNRDAMCIEIAEQKATIVDLGELEPGQYTISAAGGDAKPVTVSIS
jgi:hypothetical protein